MVDRVRALGVGFVAAFVFLVAALAYNMGATAEESRGEAAAARLTARLDSSVTRLRGCERTLQAVKNTANATATMTTRVREQASQLRTENQQAERGIELAQKSVRECEQDNARDRERLTGTSEINATAAILRMQYEVLALQHALSDVNASIYQAHDRRVALLVAYRRANLYLAELANETIAPVPPIPSPTSAVTQPLVPAAPVVPMPSPPNQTVLPSGQPAPSG